jgi:hypothetical protein
MSIQENLINIHSKNLFEIPLDEVEIGAGVVPSGMDESESMSSMPSNFENPQLFDKIVLTGGASQPPPPSSELRTVQPLKLSQVEIAPNQPQQHNQQHTQQYNQQHGGNEMRGPIPTQKLLESNGNLPSHLRTSVNLSEVQVNPDMGIFEQKGGYMNLEDIEVNEVDDNPDNLIEETGNLDNPGEDMLNADDDQFDEQEKPPTWNNPELTIENDLDMIHKMDEDEINAKVAMYVDYYNSDEYHEYLKYYQIIYAASPYKYAIRRDKDSIYLVKRKDVNAGKKTKETVEDIIKKNSDPVKDYMIKLTFPEYASIKEELSKVNHQINILSGQLKLIQKDLLDLGVDIKKEDVKTFEKLRDRFYKYINRRQVYTKYFIDVNGLLSDDSSTHNLRIAEVISYENENDIKLYKLQYQVVNAPDNIISNITEQLKTNIEKYSEIMNLDMDMDMDIDTNKKEKGKEKEKENSKEYSKQIKDFLLNKKSNETKYQKELNLLLNLKKGQIDYIIKKLPVVDVVSEP